jgi:hypothetical protein
MRFGTNRTVFGTHSKVNDNTIVEVCINNLALTKNTLAMKKLITLCIVYAMSCFSQNIDVDILKAIHSLNHFLLMISSGLFQIPMPMYMSVLLSPWQL